jgi:hypothetical protein
VIGFTSLGATWKAGQFINVDIFLVRLSKRGQLWFSLLAILASLVCTAILIWFSIQAGIRAFAGGARPTNINMPLGIWKFFVPIALGALLVEVTISLVKTVRQLIVNEAGRPCRVRLLWHVRQRLVSVKPHGLVSEYYSIAYLYSALPFNGRIPVFIGDDKQAV